MASAVDGTDEMRADRSGGRFTAMWATTRPLARTRTGKGTQMMIQAVVEFRLDHVEIEFVNSLDLTKAPKGATVMASKHQHWARPG